VGKGPSDRNEANEAILHLRRGCECGIVTRSQNIRARLKYNSKYQAWTRRVQRYRVAMLTVKI